MSLTLCFVFCFFVFLSQLVESEILEILMALSRDSNPEMSAVRACADRALKGAVQFDLIKRNEENE